MPLANPTRRAFFQSLAATSCAAVLPGATVYRGRADCIEVLRIENCRTHKIQVVSSAHPSGFAVDPFRHRLFVANDIDQYQGLPTGSIESYAINPASGQITLADWCPLSLSATNPKQLAISPDGKHLVVAAYGGGAYNVLPVQPGGSLGTVTQVLKEIGSGPHPVMQTTAHPHSVAFHPSGKFVVSTDFGADRITVFSFESGRLRRLQQIATPPGSGPAGLYVTEHHISVEHELQPFRCSYRLFSQNVPGLGDVSHTQGATAFQPSPIQSGKPRFWHHPGFEGAL